MGVLGLHGRNHLRDALFGRRQRQDRRPQGPRPRLWNVHRRQRTDCPVRNHFARTRVGLADVLHDDRRAIDHADRVRVVPAGSLCRSQEVHEPQDGRDGLCGRLRSHEPGRVLFRLRVAGHTPPLREHLPSERPQRSLLDLHRAVRRGATHHPGDPHPHDRCSGRGTGSAGGGGVRKRKWHR